MDTFKTIKALVNTKRNALTQKPLAEFAVLGVLLFGLQHGFNGNRGTVMSAVSPPGAFGVIAAQHQSLIFSTVDRINNGAWPAHQTAHDSPTHALANKPASKFKSMAEQARPSYQFNRVVGKARFKTAWAVNIESQEPLAIGQTHKTFAFATKPSASKKLEAADDKFVIMLDPGHGGSDPGSVGHNGLQEKQLTLDIAKRAQRILSKIDGVSVVLTRDDDTGMSRKSRVHKVKKANADMVVSLHLNHLPQADVNLVETFYAAPHNILESIEKQRMAQNTFSMMKAGAKKIDLAFTQGSKQLASMMQNRVYSEVSHDHKETDDAGIKEDTLYILTRSFTPGVLIELSCLSNIREAERLADPAYRNRLAEALAEGVQDYLVTPAAKQQFGSGV